MTVYVVAPRIGYPIKGIFVTPSAACEYQCMFPRCNVFEVDLNQLYVGSRLSGESVLKTPDDRKYILK